MTSKRSKISGILIVKVEIFDFMAHRVFLVVILMTSKRSKISDILIVKVEIFDFTAHQVFLVNDIIFVINLNKAIFIQLWIESFQN